LISLSSLKKDIKILFDCALPGRKIEIEKYHTKEKTVNFLFYAHLNNSMALRRSLFLHPRQETGDPPFHKTNGCAVDAGIMSII